jgi:hypothetical protein
MTTEYDNPKLWALVSDEWGKDYVSVAASLPEKWTLGQWPNDELRYVSGEYEIRARKCGARRSYTVWRQDVELPLSLTGSLADAKARAVNNANGLDGVHVA